MVIRRRPRELAASRCRRRSAASDLRCALEGGHEQLRPPPQAQPGPFPKKIPKEVQLFKSDCEKLVERYNTLLKEISEYMKEHSKPNHEDPENSAITLSYYDTDSFFLISIKEDLEILTNDCEELLEKGVKHPEDVHLQSGVIEQNLKQLRELRRYSEQIETALDEYEENIMKIEEEISNNTLCN